MVSGPPRGVVGFDEIVGMTFTMALRRTTDANRVIGPRGHVHHRLEYGLDHRGTNPVNQ